MSALLCFGGPLNEQTVTIPDDRHYWVAAVKPKPSRYLALNEAPWIDPRLWDAAADLSLRTVTYTVEKVAWHDEARCEQHTMLTHTDRCTWMARCLIAEGFPRHRITDVLNAIGGMTRLLSG